MLRILLTTVLLVLVVRAVLRIAVAASATARAPRTPGDAQAVKLVRDPVCGTYVAPGTAVSLRTRGRTEYFCSEQCRERFEASA